MLKMITLNNNSDSFRSLSTIFTPANFRRIVKESNINPTLGKIKKHVGRTKNRTFVSVLEFLYREMQANYRNEYVFKNTLLNKELLEYYSLSNTTVLNEFRIGSSVADLVLLNGEIRVFEIKTDLDSLEKLDKQIQDYQKFANKVFVVISQRNVDRMMGKYDKTKVGIIVLEENGLLTHLKDAESQIEMLDHEALFKTMRQGEYCELIREHFDELPNVPNTRIFSECLRFAREIEISTFQSSVMAKLKSRNLRCPELLASTETPMELKHICCTLDFSRYEYGNLYSFLNRSL